MEREHPRLAVSENELHAFVDDRLPAARRREVAAYLDAHPAADDRVASYAHQRGALALLRRHLMAGPVPPRLAGLEAALVDAVSRQGRARRTVAHAAAWPWSPPSAGRQR